MEFLILDVVQPTGSVPGRMAPPKELEDRLAALWRLWREKRADARLPGRSDFDPLEMGLLLPNIFLIDVLSREPLLLRYRLVGTAIVTAIGRDNTGRHVDEAHSGDNWREAEVEYRKTVLDGNPAWRWCQGTRSDGRPYRYQQILLPLARDGRMVDMLLGGAVHVS